MDRIKLKEFYGHIKNMQFESARDIYADIAGAVAPSKEMHRNVLGALLTTCSKKEHLSYAISIVEELKSLGTQLTDGHYVPLIRCCCDGSNIDDAFEYIREMKNSNLQMKLRVFSPIIEHYCSRKDSEGTLRALSVALALNSFGLFPDTKHVILIMKTALMSGAIKRSVFKRDMDELLSRTAEEHYGVVHDDAIDLVSCMRSLPVSDVMAEGTLAADPGSIPGKILKFNKNGTVVARDYRPLPEPYVSRDQGHSTVTAYAPQKSSLRSMDEMLYSVLKYDSAQGQPSSPPQHSASIVHIPNLTSTCPNCEAHLPACTLTDRDREDIRRALIDICRSRGERTLQAIKAFDIWLHRKREPYYDYVIDGANAAYMHQNHNEGKFSYEQIEALYDSIKRRIGENTRILVFIPLPYTKATRPNSVGRSATKRSANDERILDRLKREDALYIVGSGVDDDLSIIYATLCCQSDRVNHTYAVTNDMMRNHRVLAFMNPRVFYRWQTTQVVNYAFERPFPMLSKNTAKTFLVHPAPFVREIQYASSKDRWHVPIVDKHSWLCLKHHDREQSLFVDTQ